MVPSGGTRPSLSSRLVDVDEPMLVDVVDVPPLLVDVVPGMLVDVEDEDGDDPLESTLVEVVSAVVGDDDDVGVVALVDVGGPPSDVTVACDEFVSSDVLLDSVAAVVTDVEVPSSALAHATPTTASAATTDVTIPTIFLTIQCLLRG